MNAPSNSKITFARLSLISPEEIAAHMSDPRLAEHMPLLEPVSWDLDAATRFIASKERYWNRDGLGHWAILCNDSYVGWGGFQKEGDEWDYGLVLKPDFFGLGGVITRQALAFARTDARIPYVTFLLPPSRKNLGALNRLGAKFVKKTEHEGTTFLKYRLDTT
nr:GNAT family N-acetyltransferase [Kiloniella laminariae]